MSESTKKHILLVEDQALIAMAGTMQLEKYGYAVRTVSTGEKAIAAVQEYSDIDLILMDIDLGSGIDGTQAAEVILKDHDLPVVFLSSHTEPEIVEKTEKITSYGYVVKKSDASVLDASIKMAFKLFDVNRRLSEELTARKRIEAGLHESEEKFRALFEKGPIGVAYHEMVYDDSGRAIDYRFLDANTSYIELTGVDPRGKLVTEAFPGIEDDPFDWIGTFGRVANTGEEIRFEQYLQPNERWYDCVGYQVKPGFFVAAFIEITERKHAEREIQKQLDEKELLLREVHHRVKNNIANVESLLSLQAGSTENAEAKATLQGAISRVQSMRVLYDKLLLSKELHEVSVKDYAEGLIDSLVMFFDPENRVFIEKQLVDFTIPAKQATTLGIILNELLTNVFKYAFDDQEKGMVTVSIHKEEREVTLVIQDNGVGFDERALANESPGFGFTIVKMLVDQFNGSCSLSNCNGARSVVRLEI